MPENSFNFAVGGPVQVKHGTYLPRQADKDLFAACKAGEFAYVLACRQIGKTSLMVETAQRLRQEGVRTALIDLNRIGKVKDAEQWYFSLITELADALKLQVDVDEWWQERPSLSTLPQRFGQFLRYVVLAEIQEPIVIFIDEIDMTLGLDLTDDFFAAIRTFYNDRAQEPTHYRLTFVLLGVATPDELIKDSSRTPFNIGQAITLRDFTRDECAPFRTEIETRYPSQRSQYFEQIYTWTYGHPYLTQKLCKAFRDEPAINGPDLVEELVEKLFLRPAERGDDNLQFVQDRVRNDPYAEVMLRIYKQILLDQEAVWDDEKSTPINRLKLYGLVVVVRNGKLKVRNKLYARFFNSDWVDGMSRSIRQGIPNHYTILKKIGQLGFVTVYLTQTMQNSQETQTAALKVVDLRDVSEVDWGKWLTWLEQDIKAVARLSHPNIIVIFEADYNDNEKTIFIGMKYIAGGSLRDKLRISPLGYQEAMEIIKEIGTALAHAHSQDIFHLGVYPNNILLDISQEPAQPVLTDFGFAKLVPKNEQTQAYPQPMLLVHHYMAPELWQKQPPTPATDVYSLAVTFFEMLAGQLPANRWPGDTLPRLSKVASGLRELFDDILIKATAQNPADRYQSVTDFIKALENAPQKEVEKLLRVAQDYMKVGQYDPNIALAMLEDALEIYPEYPEALRMRGQIRLKQAQFAEALADYERAYEQELAQNLFSNASRDYILALNQVADIYWQRQNFTEAVKYYEEIRQILDGQIYDGDIQKIEQLTLARLVEYHYREGQQAYEARNLANLLEAAERLQKEIEALELLAAPVESQGLHAKLRLLQIEHYYNLGIQAYADGEPEEINWAIETLDSEIEILEALAAAPESQDLQQKLKLLYIKKYKEVIEQEQTIIVNLGSQDDEKMIFQHYVNIDDTYQKLIELEPENYEWLSLRHKNLKETAERRQHFAVKAEEELDYQISLSHYLAILNIEEIRFKGIVQGLPFDLQAKIAELKTKIGYDQKYREIIDLVNQGKHLIALDQLVQEFISVGNYEHRDVARLFWELIYAKQHEGKFPEFKREQEATAAQNKLANAELELAIIKAELAKVQSRSGQPRQEATGQLEASVSIQGEWAKALRNHELNKYLIPISLLAAVLAGGIIANQITLLIVPIIASLALLLLIAYFVYYLWMYYWPPFSE